jgi:hypothetical protein
MENRAHCITLQKIRHVPIDGNIGYMSILGFFPFDQAKQPVELMEAVFTKDHRIKQPAPPSVHPLYQKRTSPPKARQTTR